MPSPDEQATIRRLKAELQRALEDVADLRARLDYAEGQIRELRARVVGRINQAAPPQ
jgi:phage shock protein A